MSRYLLRASAPIKPDSSDFLNVSRLKALMQKIPISTPVNVSLVVDALNLLCKQKKQKILQLSPLALLKLSRLVTELELVPMSRNVPYVSPSCSSILYYTAVRNDRGAITEVIDVLV